MSEPKKRMSLGAFLGCVFAVPFAITVVAGAGSEPTKTEKVPEKALTAYEACVKRNMIDMRVLVAASTAAIEGRITDTRPSDIPSEEQVAPTVHEFCTRLMEFGKRMDEVRAQPLPAYIGEIQTAKAARPTLEKAYQRYAIIDYCVQLNRGNINAYEMERAEVVATAIADKAVALDPTINTDQLWDVTAASVYTQGYRLIIEEKGSDYCPLIKHQLLGTSPYER